MTEEAKGLFLIEGKAEILVERGRSGDCSIGFLLYVDSKARRMASGFHFFAVGRSRETREANWLDISGKCLKRGTQ